MVLRNMRFMVPAFLAWAAWLGSAGAASALCVQGVEAWDTLRMRSAPDPRAREVGAIPPRACGVAIVGACRGAWCPVQWSHFRGWSNTYYLEQGGFGAGLRMPGWGHIAAPPRPPAVRTVAVPARRIANAPRRPEQRRLASIERVVPQRTAKREAEPRESSPPPPPRAAVNPPPPLPAAPPPVAAASPADSAAAPVPAPTPAAPAASAALSMPAAAATAGSADVCIVNVATGDTLKVRAGPGLDQALRFGFPSGACGVKLTGQCRDGWCPVDYRGYKGWAEQRFLK
jgi:uncharacterized protein YraI